MVLLLLYQSFMVDYSVSKLADIDIPQKRTDSGTLMVDGGITDTQVLIRRFQNAQPSRRFNQEACLSYKTRTEARIKSL